MWLRTPCSGCRAAVAAVVFGTSIGATMLSGCSESPMRPQSERGSGNPVLTLSRTAADISLSPSGDQTGNTDADVIEHALAVAAPGSIIELGAGTFYVNRTLSAPVGFNGTLRGAGRDATTLLGIGSVATPFRGLMLRAPGSIALIHGSALIVFRNPSAQLTVSDLTASLGQNFVAEADEFGSTDLTMFFAVELPRGAANTSFQNVRLLGQTSTGVDPFPGTDYQPLWGITVIGDGNSFPFFASGGRHDVTNSDIKKIGIQAIVSEMLSHGSVQLADNTLRDVKQVITRWLDGTSVSVTDNTIESYSFGAIVVTQEGSAIPGDISNVLIRNNTVTVRGYLGIEIGYIPPWTAPDFNLLIEKNTITQAGPDPIGFFANIAGIGMLDGQEGAVVRNNIIRGSSAYAIATEGVNNSMFAGNNLEGLTALGASLALFGSSYNTIVGTGNSTVWNFGAGNVITGMTSAAGDATLGTRMREAQERRREILASVTR